MSENRLIFPPPIKLAVLIPVFIGGKFSNFLRKSNLTQLIDVSLYIAVKYRRFNPLNPFFIKSSTEILILIPYFDAKQDNCQVQTFTIAYFILKPSNLKMLQNSLFTGIFECLSNFICTTIQCLGRHLFTKDRTPLLHLIHFRQNSEGIILRW